MGAYPDAMETELATTDRRSWPELPWRDWQPTISTLHMWTQIVGKVRMALAPPLNHWWHVALYVTPRGLSTTAIPDEDRTFQVDFDFVEHRLQVVDSDDGSFELKLAPMSVATFYRSFMDGLRGLGIDVTIRARPVEVADAIPFASDEAHAAYVPDHVEALRRALIDADRVMQTFRSGFVGKASPVNFFWGSFDLAATRYSGRPAPLHPGGSPNCPVWVMQEAYSREETSVGWWPSSEPPGPAFYAYAYPEPDGYKTATVRPAHAHYDPRLGEFILPYDAVRGAADPDSSVLAFFESTYAAGASLGGWDRSTLEPAVRPQRALNGPWSTIGPRRDADPAIDIEPHRHRRRE